MRECEAVRSKELSTVVKNLLTNGEVRTTTSKAKEVNESATKKVLPNAATAKLFGNPKSAEL
jgi:ribosomal protein L17